jgi:hypothetical protein
MYVLSGKGTEAGAELVSYISSKCKDRGVLFDDDFPEYTLDFKTQLPSVSKSIREKDTKELIFNIQKALRENEESHEYYMILCLTAHKLLGNIKTKLVNVNLWIPALERVGGFDSKIAYLGTTESYPPPPPHTHTHHHQTAIYAAIQRRDWQIGFASESYGNNRGPHLIDKKGL